MSTGTQICLSGTSLFITQKSENMDAQAADLPVKSSFPTFVLRIKSIYWFGESIES